MRDVLSRRCVAAVAGATLLVAVGGGVSAQLQNTERELVDALQTMHRDAKDKKPKTKIKIAPLKPQPMMGDVRSHTGKMRDIGTDRRRVRKRN